MPAIKNPQDVFHFPLNAEEEQGLREICEGMKAKISTKLQQKEYADANTLLDSLDLIKAIDHPLVETLVDQCKNAVFLGFRKIRGQILNEAEWAQVKKEFNEHLEALHKAWAEDRERFEKRMQESNAIVAKLQAQLQLQL